MGIDLSKVEAALREDRLKLEKVEEAFRIVAEYQRSRLGAEAIPASPAKEVPVVDTSALTSENLARFPGMSKTDMVKAAVEICPGIFDLNHVMAAVEKKGFPLVRADVSFILSRLSKSNFYRTVEAGSGKRPTLFSKFPPSLPETPEPSKILSLDELADFARRGSSAKDSTPEDGVTLDDDDGV